MTTFKQYLQESGDNPDLSGFKKNAKLMLDNNILLYRGTGTQKNDFKIGKTTGAIRAARSIERRAKGSRTAMEISSGWEIPKRNLSYFVTRDAKHAAMFGQLILVIPSDDVELFAWTGTDFNQSGGDDYKKQFSDMESATTSLLFGMANLSADEDEKGAETALKLIRLVKSMGMKVHQLAGLAPNSTTATDVVDAVLKLYDTIKAAPRTIDDAIDRNMSVDYIARHVLPVLDTIKRAMEKTKATKASEVYANATQKSFKIKTFKTLDKIPKKLKTPDELWFNGRYLAINLESRYHHPEDIHEILNAILET